MTKDELRILAGLPTKNNAEARQTLMLKEAENLVHSFDVDNERDAASLCIALAKDGLTVDMEFAMGVFYFNFKNKAQAEKAEAVVKRIIKEEAELTEAKAKKFTLIMRDSSALEDSVNEGFTNGSLTEEDQEKALSIGKKFLKYGEELHLEINLNTEKATVIKQ